MSSAPVFTSPAASCAIVGQEFSFTVTTDGDPAADVMAFSYGPEVQLSDLDLPDLAPGVYSELLRRRGDLPIIDLAASPGGGGLILAVMPPGLTFSDNHDGTGTFAGTPQSESEGNYQFLITAQNGYLPYAKQQFGLTVADASFWE